MPDRKSLPVADTAPSGRGKRGGRGAVQGLGLAAIVLGLVAWYGSRLLRWVELDPDLVGGIAAVALPIFSAGAVLFWVGSLIPRRRAEPPPSE